MAAKGGAVLATVVLAACPWAFALDASLDISQYAHHAWTIRDGFFQGIINSIAQTPDGYLWLGSELGLMRFDGVRAVPWRPPAGQSLPSEIIFSLLSARDGRLWIGTLKGLASWKNGKLTEYPELAGAATLSLFEDQEATIWAGTAEVSIGRLCAIRNNSVQCHGQDGSLGNAVNAIYEKNGILWVSTAAGLWQWNSGIPKFFPIPRSGMQGLTGDGDRLLVSIPGGLRQINEGKVEKFPTPPSLPVDAEKLFRDRDGGLWIGTNSHGLFHLHQGRLDQVNRNNGLSGDAVNWLFQDREGSIWVATTHGLDRFRDVSVPTISTPQGLSSDNAWSVLAARDGTVWLGTRDGLNLLKDGQVTVYRKGKPLQEQPFSLFQDHLGRIWASALNGSSFFENGRFVPVGSLPKGQVHSITEDSSGNIFFSYDDALVELRKDGLVQKTPWSDLGLKEYAIVELPDPAGGIWLGFVLDGGVARFKDGQILAFYKPANGLGQGFVTDLQLDRDGTLWVSTAGGLSRIKNGRIATLTTASGLPCDIVHWMREDDEHFVWLYTSCGLVKMARSELDRWSADPKRRIEATVLDSSAGVHLRAFVSGYSPRVAKTAGKFWFVGGEGVSVLDPRHLVINKIPPPVHIEQVKADGKDYEATEGLRLPALIRNVWIDYTALCLAAPERIHFKYKLEGQDRDWTEVVNNREVQYSNLPPRHYRFRVMAANNSGVWNEAGASLDFSIAPAYYQAWWFQASCGIAILALLWGLYRLRVYQVAREFNLRLEERVGERTRIARDLHDTLLQSFHGLMLRLQAVDDLLPEGKAKQQLEQTLERADQAIAEGRSAVYDLRSSATLTNDLPQAVRALGEELATNDPVAFHLFVEGEARDLHPIIRDEIYRITCEGLRNAFHHACAHNIETEITYGERVFRLRIRDDGVGIPTEVMEKGRPGHYGLRGMRERAKEIGGKLTVWSGARAGTEIELSVASSSAYSTSTGRHLLRLFRKKAG